jgi:hypothetical protein
MFIIALRTSASLSLSFAVSGKGPTLLYALCILLNLMELDVGSTRTFVVKLEMGSVHSLLTYFAVGTYLLVCVAVLVTSYAR